MIKHATIIHHIVKGMIAACIMSALMIAGGCAGKSTPPPGAHPAGARDTYASGKSTAIVRTARSLIGQPYKWGGTSPGSGFDCSGLAWFVYRQNGVSIPRTSWQQFTVGTGISRKALRPADLVFYKVTKKGKTLHVGIVTDRGTFIHSPSSGKQVTESPLSNPYWQKHFIGARRVF